MVDNTTNLTSPIVVYPPDVPEPTTAPDTGTSLATPAQDPDTGVSLATPGPPMPILPDAVAQERAKKMQEGIGQHIEKTAPEIKDGIQSGQEQSYREQAAAIQTENNTRQKMQNLIDLANRKGAPLSEDEFNATWDPYNPNNKPVSPDSVVETQYSTKYIKNLSEAVTALPNNPVQEAQQEIPEQAQESFLKGSELVARMEAYKKIKEDMEAEVSKQSIPGVIADAVKQMWQPYTEAKMRGLTSGPQSGYFTGIDVGSNIKAQADHIFSMPLDQSIAEARRITNKLAEDNPQLAVRFAEYLEGLPISDRILDGTFSYMVPLDIAAVGKGVLGLARRLSLANRTNKAVKDFVRAADLVKTDGAGRAEASGDLNKAAEIKSTDLILQNMNGQSDPIKLATDDTLLTFLNQDKAKIATDTGKLSKTQVTLIQNAYAKSGQTLLQRILDAARINRIPMPLAVQNSVKIVRDAVIDYFPGIKNAILDVSNPLYEPKSNTYWHEITFGNHGGKLFSNPDTAKNFAKQYGLDAKVLEGYGAITPPEMEKMLADKAKISSQITEWEQTVLRRQKEAKDASLTPEARQYADEQAKGIPEHIKAAKQQADDLDLKIKGKETYKRVKGLESDIDQLKLKSKDLRDSLKKTEVDAATRASVEETVALNKAQIREKALEVNAIKQGKASVLGNGNSIEQHGVGWKIVVRRPLVETDKAVRDLLIRDASGKLIPEAISTGSQDGFKSLLNAAALRFRGADDTLSLNESINRKIGTYTQSLFKEWAAQEAAYIKQIATGVIKTDPVTGEAIPFYRSAGRAIIDKVTGKTKRQYDEFVRTLNFARTAEHPDTGQVGYFFDTPGLLDTHYRTYYDRSPTFAENEGYFAFVRMVEGDRIMRELAEFRNRARLGVEQHSLSAMGPNGKMVKSDFFDGRVLKNFPGGDDVLMVMGRRLGDEQIYNLGGSSIQGKRLERMREDVKLGKLKVIEVYASEHTPLRNFSDVAGNEHVRYILTDSVETKPMEFNHVNRRGGGHFEYDYDHFIKQANMYHQYEGGIKGAYKSVYTGDTTFMPTLNKIMGNDIAKKMNEIARMIREGDLEGAKRYTQAHLPIEFDDLHKMFRPGRDDQGKVVPPQLDLDPRNPFRVTSGNKKIIDIDKTLEDTYGKGIFKEGAKSGSLNKQFNVAFNTERESAGLRHLDDVGSANNPLYKYAPEGKMIDPITTMNRSLNRIVNTTFMDDYKMYAVEHWLQEATPYLKAGDTEIAASPYWHFQSSDDKSMFKPDAPWEKVQNLLSNRYKIQQFLGVPSQMDVALNRATEMITNQTYASMGPMMNRGIGGKLAEIVPLWMINHIKDPFTQMRSFTFHAKLGLWNPAQLLVQAQSFATILAVSPLHGMSGTYATLLHQWSRVAHSEEFINTLDRYATKLSVLGQSKWKPGEFKEAMKLLEATGFDKVAGEHANLNTALKTDFVGNTFKGLLNGGTVFFREGEKSTRVGAWYTAYREFRTANPTGAVSKSDLGKILQRADLLTANMSRASNSALQSGYLSLTTQFLTYQIRLAELMMGGRIDRAAKGRLLTFYALLYGAPSAVGLSGLPLANSIRQEAIERGYVVGDNWISTAIDQGLPAIAAALITGNGDFRKGYNYNFGERYGSQGFTSFVGNKSIYEWLAGASGSTLMGTLTSTSNFLHAAASILKPNNTDKQFPLKLDDFVDIFKEISSANSLWKVIMAVNTGKWMSKNEGYIGPVTKWNATFMALTGVSPQQQSDAYLKGNIKQAELDLQKHVMKEATKEYQRYLQAAKEGNPQQAKDYFRRADTMLTISGMPMERRVQFLTDAARSYKGTIVDTDFNFQESNVPVTKSTFLGASMPFTTQNDVPDVRREQFRKQLQLDEYKNN